MLSLVLAGAAFAATNLPADDDLPPLRPPRAEIPATYWEQHGWWVILGGALLLALAGFGLWLLLRRKPPVLLPPAAQARQALEPLRNQPENGLVLSRVSQVVRHYFSGAFGLPPGELNTTEFSRALTGLDRVGPDLAVAVTDFLLQCDQRKFAPSPPQPPLGAVTQAGRLIDQAEARRLASQAVAGSA